MPRRGDPDRIYQAQRAGRLDQLDAEHWISRWEREAEGQDVGRFSPEFWQEGDTGSLRTGAGSPGLASTNGSRR